MSAALCSYGPPVSSTCPMLVLVHPPLTSLPDSIRFESNTLMLSGKMPTDGLPATLVSTETVTCNQTSRRHPFMK